ncbi:LAME_0F13322g1_1 [Lachancea meyersii CBS 8951]|uniref:LAME_0F13322g1_1 n=1 Tax=Lachancea meyersii CBS 8951 TaxID=1266667 RepID=A0A1G4JXC0_9SACH|nr:LAME_0F13322g1_1 [Lachancea meyersii CBS 8951]
MIRNSIVNFTRAFHVQSCFNGSQVKGKLRHFERYNKVTRRSPAELERLAEKRRLSLKKLNKKAYSKQHAEHILKSKYEVSEDTLRSATLGPTSGSDVKFLKLAHDRRLIFTILGVTGEQLRDSKLVANDVAKFLARGQLDKAVFLARLAKSRGIVGMNKIIEHFCREQQDGKSAIDLYTWRKKWGIPPNEFTATILFDGLAKLRQPLGQKLASRVLKIAMQLINNETINLTEFNAALSALVNCKDEELVFELYDAKPKSLIGDAITYTLLLRGATKMQNDQLCLKRVDTIMAGVPKRFLDARLMHDYCRVWHHRSDKDLSSIASAALLKYFNVGDDLPTLQIPSGVNLPDLQYWDVRRKYDANSFVIDLLLENYAKNGKFELALKTYRQLIDKQSQLLPPSSYEKMIKTVTSGFPNKCGPLAVQIFDELNKHHKTKKNRMILVYKAFERQAGRKFTNESSSKIDILIEDLFKFAQGLEGKKSGLNGATEVLDWKAWMFCWNIIGKANERRAIDKARAKWILNQYIDTILSGQTKFNRIHQEDYSGLRHVSIESVRFLAFFADLFKSSTQISEPSEGPERDNFLYRRLLLRLKDRLLAYVAILEKKAENVESVEESLKQTAEKLRVTSMPAHITKTT